MRKWSAHSDDGARKGSTRSLLALCAATMLVAASARADDPGVCGPFDTGSDVEQAASCREPGVQLRAFPAGAPADPLAHLEAPPADAATAPLQVAGEALVAIPKDERGQLPEGLELVAGARIAASFFSPVLCATIARVAGPPEARPEDLVAALPEGAALVPHHQYVSAGARVRPFEPGTPGDPYREHQYALDVLEAERAWRVSDGAGATIALLDSAPATTHPDLDHIEMLALDAPEASGAPHRTSAEALHGTLLAGVLDATRGNGVGISGLAPGARVVALAVCHAGATGDADLCPLFDVLRGIDRAWQAGADVVNLSLVGPSDPLLERAVARLERLGRVVVAAAGNESSARPRYPAAYPSVVGVGAVDRSGARYTRSNTGLAVALYAPGVEILSTRPPAGYAFGDGTSLAAAHTSAALALLVGAGAEPGAARTALEASRVPIADTDRSGAPDGAGRMGSLCDALARVGRPCPSE